MFKTIVWATDGSESADRAMTTATTLARDNDAALIVVHCIEYMVGPRSGGVTVLPDEDDVRAKIDAQVDSLKADGIDAKATFISGSSLSGTAHMIADVARDAGADVIVVGTRGRTLLAGLLLGSVTERLLHVAPCPILAVPAKSETTAADTQTAATASA